MYQAKARMLAFDFLTDELVYRLPPSEVMLLAGMIARADNLGRLPGEPAVLLSYLYSPRPPRGDVLPDAVEHLLTELAVAERVAWYAVGGTRFAQFTRWRKHQSGLREHNLKSALPGPDAQGAVAVTLPGRTLDMFHVEPSGDAPDIGAAETTARRQSHVEAERQRLGQLIYEWCRADKGDGPLHGNDWAKLAAWLWNSGTHHPETVIALLDEVKARRPKSPYAYLAKGSEVRESITMRVNAEAEVRRHNEIKKLEQRRETA